MLTISSKRYVKTTQEKGTSASLGFLTLHNFLDGHRAVTTFGATNETKSDHEVFTNGTKQLKRAYADELTVLKKSQVNTYR
jgi:hypothetical protein